MRAKVQCEPGEAREYLASEGAFEHPILNDESDEAG